MNDMVVDERMVWMVDGMDDGESGGEDDGE